MRLAVSSLGAIVPRLGVLAGLCACQKELATNPQDLKMVGLAVLGALSGEVGGDIVNNWFKSLTEKDFDQLEHVIGEALQQICARHAREIGDVRKKWQTLADSHRAELKALSGDDIVPLLTWGEMPDAEAMRQLAGYLSQKKIVGLRLGHHLNAEEQNRLALLLARELPETIKKVLSADKSQPAWRKTLLELMIENLRQMETLHPKADAMLAGVAGVQSVVAVVQSDVRKLVRNMHRTTEGSHAHPRNIVGPIPMENADFVELGNLLQRLNDDFRSEDPQRWRVAITGDGGMGKTASAAAYCYRAHGDYEHVFWLAASDTAVLDTGLVAISRYLGLLADDEPPTGAAIARTHTWLAEHKNYLLVLDGVEDVQDVAFSFPKPLRGRLLLTTRLTEMAPLDFVRSLAIPEMEPDTAVAFLYRRTQRTPQEEAERAEVRRLVVALDTSPLLLELAAAYLWRPDRAFADFRAAFERDKLAQPALKEDPKLAAALTLYERLYTELQHSKALLARIVFLNPESIREDILRDLSRSNPGMLQPALNELERVSLLQRQGDGADWSMHRLVQEAVKRQMSEANRKAYVTRLMELLEGLLPPPTIEDWERVEALLTHTLVAADNVARYGVQSIKAGILLHRACLYLLHTERFPAAASLLPRLNAQELALGITPDKLQALMHHALSIETEAMAHALNNIAYDYYQAGRYAEAEPLYVRALTIRKRVLGPQHPDIASSLNNLAGLYQSQGRYEEAEPLHEEALAMRRKSLPEGHPHIATSLNNLAGLYRSQGRYEKAEPLLVEALAIDRKSLPKGHPDIAQSLNNLAVLYYGQGRYEEAEPMYEQALAMRRESLPEGHPDIASSLSSLAELYRNQGRYEEAEPLIVEALAIFRKSLPEGHPDIASSLSSLAELYRNQGRYEEAEPLIVEALAIFRKSLPEGHPDIATSLNNLAGLYESQGRYEKAEPMHVEALTMRRKSLPKGHPDIAQSLNNLALLYYNQNRYEKAEPLIVEALAICHKSLPEGHPHIAQSLNGLAALYYGQGRYEEAEPLSVEALAIAEKSLGTNHPDTELYRGNLQALRGRKK